MPSSGGFAASSAIGNRRANLRVIASQLNLGLDSLVFHRRRTGHLRGRRSLEPAVTVIEMSGDAYFFAQN